MNHQDQTFHFADDLDKLVERYRQEYEMTYASMVGALQMKIHLLCNEADALNEDER